MSAREHVLRLQEELSKYQLLPSGQLVQPSLQSSGQPSASINSAVAAEEEVAKLRRELQDVTQRLQEVTQQLLRYQPTLLPPNETNLN